MYSTVSSITPFYITHVFLTEVHSLGISAREVLSGTAKKIKEAVTSPFGQGVIGFGLGLGINKIDGPLTNKIVKFLGVTSQPDPFNSNLGLGSKIFLTPFLCIIGPILEENLFRGNLQEALKGKFESFYLDRGFSASGAHTAARVTSVFFGSVIFGLSHFTNAMMFWCNPVLFLPQVVAATISGLIFGCAKEFSGELYIPYGMHIGTNTLVWAHYMLSALG